MSEIEKYTDSVLNLSNISTNTGRNFGTRGNWQKLSNIRIFATLSKVFSKHSGYNISDHFGDANKMALVNFVKNFSKIP